MSPLKLLLAEIGYRKLHFALSAGAVVAAVALVVAAPVLLDGYGRQTRSELARLENETRKLMRDMGFNLMIVHKDVNMSDFWAEDFAAADMPLEYVHRLASDRRLTLVTHLVATLQKKIEFEGRKVLLVGYLPEVPESHQAQTAFAQRWQEQKKPMGYDIARGTVFLGHELARGRSPGEMVKVLDREFAIARVLPEQGSKEDITIAMHLSDAQALMGLDRPPRINQIMALGCNCAGSDLPNIRRQLETILPDTRVTEFRSIALARAEQRGQVARSRAEVEETLQTLAGVVTPAVVLAAAVWVGLLALVNVRERRTEIGILRAVGKPTGAIAALFLGKAALVGLSGAVVGAALGVAVGRWVGAGVLGVPDEYFRVPLAVGLAALAGAPVVSILAAYLPTLVAVGQDPAVVLRDT